MSVLDIHCRSAAAAAEWLRSMTKESTSWFANGVLHSPISRDTTRSLNRAELLTGSCIWTDERCRDGCSECTDKVKELFHLRYQITVGDSVPAEAAAYFLELQKRFADWPVFRRERRALEIADEIRRMGQGTAYRLQQQGRPHDGGR